MITILSQPPGFSKNKVKAIIARFSGKKDGPWAVLKSLRRGLKEIKEAYQLNQWKNNIDVAQVISGVDTLRAALEKKRRGQIKKLVAGPNIVVGPADENGLLLDPLIDLILVPSEWVKNFYISVSPALASKIKVWPSGVADPGELPAQNKNLYLIYQKNAPEFLLRSVIEILSARNLFYKIINYGQFKQTEYFSSLNQAVMLIYLSPSESQGLALSEAWMRNVPTLVWQNTLWQYGKYHFEADNLSAPYLSFEAGQFFDDVKDLENKIDQFKNHPSVFAPRKYVLDNLSDKKSIEMYLKIISQ